MDTGRLVGVLATETAGMWHLSLVIDHPADEAVSTMVVGVGSRGWLLWSLGSKVGNLQGRPLGWGSPGVGSMPSQPSSHPLCQEAGASGDSVCPSTSQSPWPCREQLSGSQIICSSFSTLQPWTGANSVVNMGSDARLQRS